MGVNTISFLSAAVIAAFLTTGCGESGGFTAPGSGANNSRDASDGAGLLSFGPNGELITCEQGWAESLKAYRQLSQWSYSFEKTQDFHPPLSMRVKASGVLLERVLSISNDRIEIESIIEDFQMHSKIINSDGTTTDIPNTESGIVNRPEAQSVVTLDRENWLKYCADVMSDSVLDLLPEEFGEVKFEVDVITDRNEMVSTPAGSFNSRFVESNSVISVSGSQDPNLPGSFKSHQLTWHSNEAETFGFELRSKIKIDSSQFSTLDSRILIDIH